MLCRRLFRRDMLHAEIEDRLRKEEFDDEQVKNINAKLTGNTVMKRIFSKVKFDGRNKQNDLINENREQIIYETFKNKKFYMQNFLTPICSYVRNNLIVVC